jgi:hypothetical protein
LEALALVGAHEFGREVLAVGSDDFALVLGRVLGVESGCFGRPSSSRSWPSGWIVRLRYRDIPVPAGMGLPMMTFSLSPNSRSCFV